MRALLVMGAPIFIMGCGLMACSSTEASKAVNGSQGATGEVAASSQGSLRAGSTLNVGDKLKFSDELKSSTICSGLCDSSPDQLRKDDWVAADQFNKYGYTLKIEPGCQLKLFKEQHEYHLVAVGPVIKSEDDTETPIWTAPSPWHSSPTHPTCYATVQDDGNFVLRDDENPLTSAEATDYKTKHGGQGPDGGGNVLWATNALLPQAGADGGLHTETFMRPLGGGGGYPLPAKPDQYTVVTPEAKPYLALTAAGELVVGTGQTDRCNWEYLSSGAQVLWESYTTGKASSTVCYTSTGSTIPCGPVFVGVPAQNGKLTDAKCQPTTP